MFEKDYAVAHETAINQFIIFYIIFAVILLVIFILYLISMMKIYKKANRAGVAAIIPVYNLWILLEIVNLPKWYIVLFFVPGVNIYIYFKAMFILAKLFRKNKSFAYLMIFLPFIAMPILAFGDNEYMGISEEAMHGATVVREIEEENNLPSVEAPTVNEEVVNTFDISIGGGVYQKDYTSSLLHVESKNPKLGFKVEEMTHNFIEEEKPPPTGAEILSNVEFIKRNEEVKMNNSYDNEMTSPIDVIVPVVNDLNNSEIVETLDVNPTIPVMEETYNPGQVEPTMNMPTSSEPVVTSGFVMPEIIADPTIDVAPTVPELEIPTVEINSPIISPNPIPSDPFSAGITVDTAEEEGTTSTVVTPNILNEVVEPMPNIPEVEVPSIEVTNNVVMPVTETVTPAPSDPFANQIGASIPEQPDVNSIYNPAPVVEEVVTPTMSDPFANQLETMTAPEQPDINNIYNPNPVVEEAVQTVEPTPEPFIEQSTEVIEEVPTAAPNIASLDVVECANCRTKLKAGANQCFMCGKVL